VNEKFPDLKIVRKEALFPGGAGKETEQPIMVGDPYNVYLKQLKKS
jgi:hypothetical protein